MKTKWIILTLSSFLIITVLGVALFNGATAQGLTVTQVLIEPKPLDVYNPDGVTFYVKIVDDSHGKWIPVVDQVNPDTVVVEGWITPISTSVQKSPPQFIAVFDGTFIVSAIWTRIDHMGIVPDNPWNPIKVPLTISGALQDGTTWSGIGYATVILGTRDPAPTPG